MNAPDPRPIPAQAADLPAIRALLTRCGLPTDDLTPALLGGFVTLWQPAQPGQLLGVAGIERPVGASGDVEAPPCGLLRSLAVAPEQRGNGLGRCLLDACLAQARQSGLHTLYLIPNDDTAAAFFRHHGFRHTERSEVPAALRSLPEFTHLCPQSHPCLYRQLSASGQPSTLQETTMKQLEVFDPAMCCSTGVCGVDVDPVLAQFAADLKWVEEHGVAVTRHNLGQEPQAFAANAQVVKEMEAGMDRLPILVVDGHIVTTGMYPSRVQLAQKLGITLTTEEKPRIKAGGCGCKPGTC